MPLHKDTDGLFNRELIAKMKPGSYLVNTARGRIADRDAVVEALNSGHLAGEALPADFVRFELCFELFEIKSGHLAGYAEPPKSTLFFSTALFGQAGMLCLATTCIPLPSISRALSLSVALL